MNWMTRWPGDFPVFMEPAEGAELRDVDGNVYADLCLGDTGAMTGHAPAPTVAAVTAQLARGITSMLPTEDAAAVGEEMQRRFGLRDWQFTLSATDANRFAIRHRAPDHRAAEDPGLQPLLPRQRRRDGRRRWSTARSAARGQRRAAGRRSPRRRAWSSSTTSTALERELAARRRRLRAGRAGADQHRHRAPRATASTTALRELTRARRDAAGHRRDPHALLRARRLHPAHGLEPDLLTIGKPIAGGIPIGAYGMSAEVAERVLDDTVWRRRPTSAASAARCGQRALAGGGARDARARC